MNEKIKEKVDTRKPVKQIDIVTGEVIAIFKSVRDAGRAMGKKNGNRIGEVCSGKHKSAYGYFWQYAD